ncbi:hypothetical protein EI545_00950 [Tabrizicola piscis]|uniref:Uncharacterized protein n=1 Tax=Tabrizicola piscis TaxID=2494374 RepID=A0A3S8U1W0_9RHOB|nr:hypothetical protein [Tabrizicola piscis]AZL57535.1 hypothetical protein EI545_00950 [Tabrizicola piscis]
MTVVLMLGSAPMAAEAASWPRAPFHKVVAINNAWRVRTDWDAAVFPWDFPKDRRPVAGPGQTMVTEDDFVPVQNAFGGFVYAGATMAFTAGYWALGTLRPTVIAAFGCDMHYAATGQTHFYGTGAPDPLRKDISLRSLEAKSARLMVLAAMQGCAMVNLSTGPSRLIFPRVSRSAAGLARPQPFCPDTADKALAAEAALGYVVPSGRYWEESGRFDPRELDRLDALWVKAASLPLRQTA